MQQIPLGPPTPILQNVVYALPGRAVIIASDAPLEVSITGINWIALPTSGRTVAAFVRCPSSNTIITCKGLPRSVGGSALTYAQLVAQDGAANYWPMNDLVGPVIDVISGANGTISGTVTRGVNGPGSDKAMNFAGTGFIQLPSITVQNICSLEVWMNTTSLQQFLIYVTNRTSGDPACFTVLTQDGQGQFNNGLGTVAVPVKRIRDGVWHQIVGVSNGANILIYVDGIFEATLASVSVTKSGLGKIASDDFVGNTIATISDVAVYPLVLTPTQIAAHYSLRLSTAPPIASLLLIETGDTLLLETGDRLALQ